MRSVSVDNTFRHRYSSQLNVDIPVHVHAKVEAIITHLNNVEFWVCVLLVVFMGERDGVPQ